MGLPLLQPLYRQEIQNSFGGGMRDRDHPSLLNPDQYVYAKNGEIRDAGLMKLRRGKYKVCDGPSVGTATNVQGIVFFQPSEGNGTHVVVIDGYFWAWGNSGNTLTALSITGSGTNQLGNTTEPVSFSVGYNGTTKVLVAHVGMDSVPLYWNGDTSSGFTPFGTGDQNAPFGDLACSQSGRTLVAGNQTLPDSILFSDIRNVADGGWDLATQNIRLTTDANEVVKAMATYRDNSIIAQTAYSTQLITNLGTSTLSEIARLTIDPQFGTISPRSLVVFGRDAFFLCPDRHVRSLQRSLVAQESGVDSFPVSFFNPNLMGRINKSYMQKAAAIYFDNYYLLAVPMDANTYNSSVLPFDMLHQQDMPFGKGPVMVGEWTDWPVHQWSVGNYAGKQRLFFLSNEDGSIWEALIGDTDGVDYPAFELQPRGYQFGTDTANKTLDYGEIKYESSFGQLTIQAARDDRVFSTVKTVSIGSNAPGLPVDLPFDFGQPADESEYFYGYGLGDARTLRFKYTFAGGIINFREFIYGAFVQPTSIRG